MLAFLAALTFAVPDPATWPQWRGPTRDGVVAGTWPDTLKLTPSWRAAGLGPSYSGPIVSATTVFTTETRDKKTEWVTAFDRATGKKLWEQNWDGAMTVPFFAAANGSWIRSTPALDGNALYVAGIMDVLVCLNAKTGAMNWKLDFVEAKKAKAPDFGFVCSPLVGPDGVYVQAGGGFSKVDKATGKILWTALEDGGGTMGSAFSSPVFARLAGQDAVVVQTRTKLAAVAPDTGKVLWEKEVPSFRGMNILTPQPFGDAVFTSTYGGTTQLFNVSAAGAAPAWGVKYEGNMTSPVVVGNAAYLLGKDQKAVSFDLKTGKQAWRSEKSFGKYWSLVANKDRILALDNRGTLYLLKANPAEFEPLAEAKVGEGETWAHVAVCGAEVFVRDLSGLTAYRWDGAGP